MLGNFTVTLVYGYTVNGFSSNLLTSEKESTLKENNLLPTEFFPFRVPVS